MAREWLLNIKFLFLWQLIKSEGLNLQTARSTPQEDFYRQSAEVTTSVANGIIPSPHVSPSTRNIVSLSLHIPVLKT